MKTQKDPLQQTVKLGVASFLAMALLAGCNDSTTIVQADNDPPAIPTGVYTITGDRYVEVLWNPVRQNDIAGYGVYRSSTNEGPYQRLATLEQPLADNYIDDNVVNGVTYYYAVDAFDFAGNESELSYETAFDTPRPAGFDETVFALQQSATQSGIDFSRWNGPGFVTSWTGNSTDLYFHRVGTVLFARGTVINGLPNDIQDLGYTNSLDEISWAPTEGWSVAPNGVEMILGHTYVVWTHDSFFAKFRVTSVLGPINAPTGAIIDWAYQIDQNNPELSPPLVLGGSGDNSGDDLMRAATLTGCIAAVAIVLAAASTGAAPSATTVDVQVRVTAVAPESGARVEFTPARSSFVALYGVFSDGSLRALFPEVDGVNTWVEARETRVVEVPLPQGLRLESVQAVASVRWFDPGDLGIAAARPDRPAGLDVRKELATGWEAA